MQKKSLVGVGSNLRFFIMKKKQRCGPGAVKGREDIENYK